MSLPKIDVPTFELILPSTGKPVRVRPFVVKEEKLLLMALASKDDNQIIETTKQIVNNCMLTPGVDVEKLPFFDIDYLFIALRAKSVGEAIEVNFTCNRLLDSGSKCGFVFGAKIDISKVEVLNMEHEKTIKLTDSITVKMKYPSYDVMKRITDKDDELSNKIKIIVASIDMVIDGNNVHSPKDYSREEFEAFVEGFTEEQFRKLAHFVEHFPYFQIVAEHECPKCHYNHKIKYRDFTSFFR